MITRRAAASGGFSLIEVMVAVAIFGVLLAIGVPLMSNWLAATKASGVTEFYAEGLRMARSEAVRHNAAGRFVLSENAISGQSDWQVDICFPTPATPCNAASGVWSTTAAPAGGDPEGTAGFKSVFRSAANLPKTNQLQPTVTPTGTTTTNFTPVGWVNTNIGGRMTRIAFAPAGDLAGKFPASALAITLAGNTVKCDPSVAVTDSRACPP